jgi:hypothetical protein
MEKHGDPRRFLFKRGYSLKLVNEDKYGAYSGVRKEFLKEFVLKESNPNFEVYDSKDESNRFIAAKCSRLPDDEDLTAGKYGINFHRAKPGFEEAIRYRNEFPASLWSQHRIHDFAFAASTQSEYQYKSSVWEKFYSFIWGEGPQTIWVTPHSGAAERKSDSDFPYPILEMDAFVAGAAARCALNNKQNASKRTMVSVHSHNWFGAIFDIGGFGVIEGEKLSTIAEEIEEKYHKKVQYLADGCRLDLSIQIVKWLLHINQTRGTLNPQELSRQSLTDTLIVHNITKGLILYGIEIADYTLDEFKTAFESLHGKEIRVISCNHIFAAELIGKELDLRGKIDHGLINTALQIECMKYCLKKNPELTSEIILDIVKRLLNL